MKNERKLAALAVLLVISCASCSTSKHMQSQPVESKKSYRLPEAHKEMHRQLLLEQQKCRNTPWIDVKNRFNL